MRIKILQLNIWKGRFLPEIVQFVKDQNIDILHFQEVSAGDMTGAPNQYKNGEGNEKDYTNTIAGMSCFEEITNQLGYKGIEVPVFAYEDDPENSYQSTATFYKPSFQLLSSQEVWLKEFTPVPRTFHNWETIGRAALICKFQKDEVTFATINTHMAWGEHPNDEPYKIDQAKILYEAVAKIEEPFVFTGDFNVVPETQTASMFDMIATNLVKKHNITNTLNPNTHTVKHLFPQGLAVDFILTSAEVKVHEFKVIDSPNLSDHYGLQAEIEI